MANMPISRYADTVGDGSGVIAATGDYSVTPQVFKVAPPVGETYVVERMIVYIEDTGLKVNFYGLDITLTNGIEIKVYRGDDVIWDVTAGLPITHNADWKSLCHDELVSSYGSGQTNEGVSYRYTFSKDGKPVVLDGDNAEELRIILSDDFSGLIEHRFRIGMIKKYN